MHIFAVVCHKITNPLIYNVRKLSKSKNALILILFDKKSADEEFIKLQKEFLGLENVEFVERISIDWAKFSQVEGSLLMMSYIQNIDYKYFSLISGDDVAIPTFNEVINLLNQSYKERCEFIGYNPSSSGASKPYNRLIINYPDFFYKRNKSRITRLRKLTVFCFLYLFRRRNICHLPHLYKGCNWFTISKEAIDYVFSYLENNPNYIESFANSYCSDEMFFQTILYNSPFRENIYGIDSEMKDCAMALRDIDWETGPEFPKVYHEEDFEKIKSRGMLFARKIDSNTPIEVLEKYFP